MNNYKSAIEEMAGRPLPEINRGKTALLVVDMVNDGNDDNGFFKKVLNFDISMMQAIEPNVIELIKESKKHDIPVIGVQSIYDFEYIPRAMREQFEAMGIKEGMAKKGSWGAEIIPKIKNLELDFILVKSHYSAFSNYTAMYSSRGDFGTGLERSLKFPKSEESKEGLISLDAYFKESIKLSGFLLSRKREIENLIITGASTHVCIDSTISGASERGYRIFLPIDAVASEDREKHYTYLHNQGIFKAQLTTTQKILDNLRKE